MATNTNSQGFSKGEVPHRAFGDKPLVHQVIIIIRTFPHAQRQLGFRFYETVKMEHHTYVNRGSLVDNGLQI